MSRLSIITPNKAQTVVEGLYRDVERRIIASPPGLCPVDMAAAFLKLCHAQTCGKCVPCRVGLGQLQVLLERVLDGKGSEDDLQLIEKTARVIKNSADCAIGTEAAEMVLRGVLGFRDDYLEHSIINAVCLTFTSLCPVWPSVLQMWIFPGILPWFPMNVMQMRYVLFERTIPL